MQGQQNMSDYYPPSNVHISRYRNIRYSTSSCTHLLCLIPTSGRHFFYDWTALIGLGFKAKLRPNTLGGTSLDKWSARRRDTQRLQDRHKSLQRYSNVQSQQASGLRLDWQRPLSCNFFFVDKQNCAYSTVVIWDITYSWIFFSAI
jgi:hypothetical protein